MSTHDITIFGATGYTGRLVAEHFLKVYGTDDGAPRWAMAGRDRAKLERVRAEIGAPDSVPLVVANGGDEASLKAMCEDTRLVISTVGPYQLHGSKLVATCAALGTDYADLCGEPAWMAAMIDAHHAAARESGARICFSSGFDSIPFDLGVLVLQTEARERFGTPCPRVRGRLRAAEGTYSGGTAASFKATMAAAAKNPAIFKLLSDPFALTPGFSGPDQPGGMMPHWEEDLNSWAAPFIMASINTKNVHRTNFLRGHPYGEDFRYDEMVLTGLGDMGKAAAQAVAGAMKSMLGDTGPKPGEGPSAEERENGFYDILFVGEGLAGGERLHLGVKGRYDPGYGSTSRMLSETAMGLLDSDAPGGIGTPGSILGMGLVPRLEERAALSFEFED